MKIENYLHETDKKHSHMVDAYAYMIACQYAKLKDDYFFLYVKKKPKYIPNFLYRWFVKNFIVIANFK